MAYTPEAKRAALMPFMWDIAVLVGEDDRRAVPAVAPVLAGVVSSRQARTGGKSTDG
jgi:hypothetical protein